jgi:hypothetical protein
MSVFRDVKKMRHFLRRLVIECRAHANGEDVCLAAFRVISAVQADGIKIRFLFHIFILLFVNSYQLSISNYQLRIADAF